MRIFWAIYESNLERLHSTALIVIALMLKEIRHRVLMMLASFSFQLFLKFSWHVSVLSNMRYVLHTV